MNLVSSLSPFLLYGLTGAVLLSFGIYSVTMHKHIYRRILAWNILGSGIFLILGALGHRNMENSLSDPLPQALVITGIVVSVSATALALAIARRISAANDEEP